MNKKTIIIIVLAALGFSVICGVFAGVTVSKMHEKEVAEESETSKPEPAEVKPEAEEAFDDPLKDYPEVDYFGEFGRDNASTGKLVSKLIDESGIDPGDILSVCSSDFAGDGGVEVFIFVGKYIEDEYESHYDGTFYYVDDKSVQKFEPTVSEWWNDYGRYFDFGKRKYYGLTEQFTTGVMTSIYSIYDGRPVVDELSGYGSIAMTGDNTGVVYHDTYDGIWDKNLEDYTGHTWKPYYFYYDENKDALCEYESEYVSEESLNSVCGTDILSEIEKAGGTYDTAYKRGNGLVTVTYYVQDDFEIIYSNATWDLNSKSYVPAWSDGSKTFSDSDYGGIYAQYLTDIW